MAKKQLISTKDILEIELAFIEDNGIADNRIGKSVHFYNYYSSGYAVLVSIDDNVQFRTPQGNRKYVILKGSYAKVINNEVQIKLLSANIISKVIVDGKEYYKFIKNSSVLSTGDVMQALTVSSNPSPKPKVNYFAEDKRLQANCNIDGEILADGLSDEGFNIVTEKFVNSILGEKQEVIDKIVEKSNIIKNKEKHNYVYNEYTGMFVTKDIYSSNLLVTSRNILKDKHRLLIIGHSGDGKTQLAYWLANEFTGEPIGKPKNLQAENYRRICIANAGIGTTLWEVDDTKSTLGKLRLFVEHIEKNSIKENCCFICNEIQSSDLRFLLGENLFEDFNDSGKSTLLPDNLYIIFTGCKDRDFGIDSQVIERIPSVEIDYIREECYEVKDKLIKAFKDKGDERVRKIVDLVGKINTAEEYQVISTRKLIDIINNINPVLAIREADLSNDGKKAYKELRKLYDN